MSDSWVCAECECENEAEEQVCGGCEAPKPAAASSGDDKYKGYVCGIVTECEGVAGKDKLKKLSVDVGKGTNLTIVTNAPNVVAGSRIVVATIGAKVTADGEEIVVKKTAVGGVSSEGIVCDGPMLGWVGGGAGTAALLPESFQPGSTPPDSRPRLK